MIAKTYATDAMCYRIAGAIDSEMADSDEGDREALKVNVVRRYALESSISKVYGSETLHHVAQNAVFMHGGYGYLAEYQVERIYRDNMVDMIYEGTNDINRMVIFDDLVRNIFSAQIPFRESVEKLDAAIRAGAFEPAEQSGVPAPLQQAARGLAAAKSALLFTINQALIHCGKNVRNEQLVMREISDALIATYAMESTLARAIDAVNTKGERETQETRAIAQLVVHESLGHVVQHTSEALLSAIEGPELDDKLETLHALHAPMISKAPVARLRRQIAELALDRGRYPF
jgi:alkylation response protein AidB-like acyl-CoA dehydrogenase